MNKLRGPALGGPVDRLLAVCVPLRRLPLWAQATGALAIISTAFLGQHFANLFANRYHFVLAMTATAVNALLWDWRIAAVGVILGGLAADFIFVEPTGVLLTDSLGDAVALANFIAVGLLEVGLVALLFEAISVSRRATAIAERSEAAKAALLVESNHRIKNNLQLIASLLSVEALSAPQEARERLLAAARRMQTMSGVHDQLSVSGDEVVDAGPFLARLCEGLAASLADRERVRVEIDVASVALAPETAAALGLLVNELFTNALKYAFPNGAAGAVKIAFRHQGGLGHLVVQDDGRGLSGATPGTGRRLVDLLVRQLGGELSVTEDSGARFQVVFPLDAAARR